VDAHSVGEASVTAVAQAIPGVDERTPWNTPRLLRAFSLAIAVFSALLLLVGEATLARARSALKTIGKDAAPSIIAAQEINSALADLDANAANYLLGTAAHRVEAVRVFEERRTQATRKLVDAAENMKYGDAERLSIREMFDHFGRYLESFAEARYRHDRGDEAGALDAYHSATQTMHTKVLAS
jgi:hypothetical protein